MNYEQLLDYIMALPIEKQLEVKTMVEKMIFEWDQDFDKLTPAEKKELDEIMEENQFIPESQIDWDEI